MNLLSSQRFHVGAIGALIALSLIRLAQHFGNDMPSELIGYTWFGIFFNAAVAGLLGVRLRQILTQSIAVKPQPGSETYAVGAGQGLIVLGFLGLVATFFSNFAGGFLRTSLMSSAASACLWIGLACIELVLANGRSAVLPPDERPSGTARFLVGMFILFAGFVLGVVAVFGLFVFSLGH